MCHQLYFPEHARTCIFMFAGEKRHNFLWEVRTSILTRMSLHAQEMYVPVVLVYTTPVLELLCYRIDNPKLCSLEIFDQVLVAVKLIIFVINV